MKLCKTLSKRGLALFLALMMCISLLPATAMAEELNAPQALCGLTEHTHGDDCYTTERKLTCTLPEDAGHTHDPAACYDETGAVICGQEEREAGHVHDPELCYADVRGDLICQLAEHVHTADCYAAAEDEMDETDSGSMAPQAVSIREPVKIDPAALVEQNSEEGYISLYGLFTCASWAGWDEMWLDYGAFLAELTLEYADGTTQTIAFAPAMQDDASTPVLLTDSQVYYNGEAVTVYAGTKVGEIEDTGALLETEITVAAGMETTLYGEEDSYRNHKWQIKITGNWTDIPYSGRGDGYDYSNSTVWVVPSGNTATVSGLKAGEVDIRHQIGGGDKWKTEDEYEVTVTASSAGNEDKTDVFLFLSLPTAKLVNNNGKMEYSGNASDYCFLGHGGNVYTSNPPAGKAVPNHQTLVNNPAQQNDVTKYVEHWPTALEPNITNTSSSPVGEGSTWTIDSATGKVSYFKLFVGNKWYSSDATQSDDKCAYEIRWVKFSYVGTDPSNVTNYGERYHIDGALFKVTTPGEIVNPDKPQEWPVVYKNLEEFYPAGTTPKDFQFQMYETDANGNRMVDSEFVPIDLVTTVTQAGVNTLLHFTQSSMNRVNDHLIPSRYAIEEALTGDDAKIWQANKVRFQANPDGTINWLDANGNVIDNGNSVAAAAASVITNSLRQYTVTGAIDHGRVSLASQTVKYGSQSQAVTFTPADGRKITSVKVTVGTQEMTYSGETLQLAENGTYTYTATAVTDNITVAVTTSDLPRTYEVRYHKNGGNWAAGITDPVPVTTDVGTLHTVGNLGNGVADPTHNDKMDETTAVPVVFLGWTATQADAQTIIPFGSSVPSSVIPKGNTTRTVSKETDFYAVWAEDRNNDREADVLQAKVTYQVAPADTGKWTAKDAASYEQFYSMPETGGSYTLQAGDVPTAAGVTVTNTSYTTEGAVWSGADLTGENATPVGQQVAANTAYTYTLTLQLMGDYEVKYYVVDLGTADANAREVTTDGYSDTVLPSGGKLPHGETVTFGTSGTVTVSIPEEVKYGDNHYVIRQIPDSITIDRHSGKKTVSVYYDLDNWTDPTQVKPGKPHDNIPDKYQVRIEYVVNSAHTALGSIQAPNAAEVKTIYNSEAEYDAQAPKLIDVPSRTAAPAGDGNAFSNWTVPDNYTWDATTDQRKAETIPTGTKLTVTGGNTYTFTANFEAKATVTYKLVSNENPTNTGLPATNPDKVKKGTTNYPVAATPAEQKTEAEKWTFDGWYTTYDEGTKTLSDKVTTATITVSDNMTLYGKWTRAAAAVAKVEYVFQNADGEVVTDGVKTALGAAMPSYTTTNSYVGDSYDFSAANMSTSIVVTAEGAYKGTYRFVSDDTSTTNATYTGTIPSGGLTITRTYQLEAVRGVEVTKAPAAGQDTTVPVKTGNNNTVVNWTITVKNTGNVSATYNISDVLTSGGTNVGDGKVTLTKDGQPLTNNQITVPKGAEPVTINAAYTVQASDAGKQLVNTATATDTADATVTASHTTTADVGDGKPTEIITVLPTVTVQKVPLKDTYILGANDDGSVDVQWKITVTNTSEVKAEGLSFTDVLKDMSGTVSITGSGLKADGTFDLEAKSAANKADTKEFTATYKATEATEAGKDLINTVTVKKDTHPLATAEAQTGIKVIPRDTSFTVVKDLTKVERKGADGQFAALPAVPATVKSGDKLTYTVTVTNTGNVPLTTTLKDVLTANGTPIEGAAQDLTVTGLTNVDNPETTNVQENQKIFTYTYEVTATDAGKKLVNTVYDSEVKDDNKKTEKEITVDKLTYRVTKTLELTDKDRDGKQLSGVTLKEGKLIIDKGADGKLVNSITLLYKITVTGDAGAAYSITDTGATPNTLTGTLDGADGATVTKDLYVTMAIGVAQNADGSLTFNNPNGSEGLSNKVTVEGGTTTGTPTDPDPAATFTVSYQYTDDVAASNRTDLTGDAYRTAIYKAGDTVTVAPAATAVGYTFSGWSYLERDNIRFDGKTFVMPEREVVLVGKFTPIAYTMQYDLHGGTADSAFAKKENVEWLSPDNQIPTAIPTRDGYKFMGWYLDSTGNKGTEFEASKAQNGSKTYKQLANDTIPTTGTITLHAGWEEVAPTFEPKDDTKPAPNGGLVKSSDKAGKVVQPGEVIHYTVEITPEKTKPATATEAAVIKGMVKSFTIKDAKLAAATDIALAGMTAGEDYTVSGTGDTREFKLTKATQEKLTVTYDYTVAADDAKPKTPAAGEKQYIENTATVTLTGDEKFSTATSNTVQVEYDVPKVEIVKYVSAIGGAAYTKDNKAAMANGTIKAKAGETITWTIEVKNNSKVDTTFTKLSDTLKVGTAESTPTLTLVELEGHGSDTPASIFIPAGGTRTLTYSYQVQDADKGAVITNVAVDADKETPPTEDETSKITVEKSEYSIKKELTDASTSVKPGDTISYKITVTNTGNVDQENLVIEDVLSYTDEGATGAPNGKVEFTNTNNVKWNAADKTFKVTKVEPGEANKVEIVYTYSVTAQDAGHTIKNTAKVEADNVEEKNPPEVTVQGAYQVVYYFDNVPADEKTVSGNAAVDEDILTKAGVTIKEKETYNGKDYALDTVVNTATGKVVAGEAAKNTVKIYYKADTNKTGTPDDYEATVIYQIDGGTWADTKVDTDRTVYVPLRTWDTTAKEWKPLTDVKPTNIPEGKHTLDSVDPGKWGLGDEVTGKVNSANAAEPKDQALEAGKIYIFKLSFDPLRAEIVDPAGEGIVEASDRTWEYDGSPHSVKADVAKAPADAKYVLYYSEDDGQTWSTDVPEVTDANEKAPTRVLVEARDSAELYQTLKTSYKLTVTPRPITITVNGASKTAGEADPVFTGGITAGKLVKEGDLGTISYVRTSNVNTTGTHTGILDAIYTANPNYAVTVIRGTLTINSSYTPPINIPTVPTGPTGPTGGTTTIEDEETPLANAVGLNDTDHFAYIIGYEDDTVRPLNNITRAEAVTIFFRLMTDEYRAANWSTENSFSDVSAGSWYNNAVSTVQKAGALEHFAQDEKFLPNQAITRAEFASIAAGFVDSAITGENVGDFSDTEGHWAALAIRKAVEAGWINGVGGNRFAPDETISRAEVMTMVNRMLDRVPDAEHMLPDMKKWTDNPEDAWYYEAVQEATNEHDYERDEMGIVETWTEILTARDWKALEAEWAANGGALTPAEPAKPAEDESETEPEKD